MDATTASRFREDLGHVFVANRQIYGRWQSVLPSRFVDELHPAHVEASSETGYSTLPGGESGFIGTVEDLGERSSYNSPGWKRLQENSGRRSHAPTIGGKAELLATSAGPSCFRCGMATPSASMATTR